MLSGIASFMKDTRIADAKQSILEDFIHFDALKCCLGSLVTVFWSRAYVLAVLMWDLTSLTALEVSGSMRWCLTAKEHLSNWCILCTRGVSDRWWNWPVSESLTAVNVRLPWVEPLGIIKLDFSTMLFLPELQANSTAMTKTRLLRDATECIIRAFHLITASQEAACAASSAVIQGYSGSGKQLLTLKLSPI